MCKHVWEATQCHEGRAVLYELVLLVISLCLCNCRGTPGWTAPELYAHNLPSPRNHKSMVCAAADVYAAGWVFFEVLCGLSPLLFREAETDADFAAGKSSIQEPGFSSLYCGVCHVYSRKRACLQHVRTICIAEVPCNCIALFGSVSFTSSEIATVPHIYQRLAMHEVNEGILKACAEAAFSQQLCVLTAPTYCDTCLVVHNASSSSKDILRQTLPCQTPACQTPACQTSACQTLPYQYQTSTYCPQHTAYPTSMVQNMVASQDITLNGPPPCTFTSCMPKHV